MDVHFVTCMHLTMATCFFYSVFNYKPNTTS